MKKHPVNWHADRLPIKPEDPNYDILIILEENRIKTCEGKMVEFEGGASLEYEITPQQRQ